MAAEGRNLRIRIWNAKNYLVSNQMRNINEWPNANRFQLDMENLVFDEVTVHVSSNPVGRRKEFEITQIPQLDDEIGWYVHTNTTWAANNANFNEPPHHQVNTRLRSVISWSNMPEAAEEFSDDALANIPFRVRDWNLICNTAYLIVVTPRTNNPLILDGGHPRGRTTAGMRQTALSSLVTVDNPVNIASVRAAHRTAMVAPRASVEAVVRGENLPADFNVVAATHEGIIAAAADIGGAGGGGGGGAGEGGGAGAGGQQH
ncbi:hypothetical protein ACH5RR_024701 [Cinchona calisaya]|uniref:Uncharacterized protein n=1 Tax=Cinchona calisaya TaxID=153742 RepID=A0ABD2YYL5_9GENT